MSKAQCQSLNIDLRHLEKQIKESTYFSKLWQPGIWQMECFDDFASGNT
jgi:hypothetical protein